jgi:hypothetical protein
MNNPSQQLTDFGGSTNNRCSHNKNYMWKEKKRCTQKTHKEPFSILLSLPPEIFMIIIKWAVFENEDNTDYKNLDTKKMISMHVFMQKNQYRFLKMIKNYSNYLFTCKKCYDARQIYGNFIYKTAFPNCYLKRKKIWNMCRNKVLKDTQYYRRKIEILSKFDEWEKLDLMRYKGRKKERENLGKPHPVKKWIPRPLSPGIKITGNINYRCHGFPMGVTSHINTRQKRGKKTNTRKLPQERTALPTLIPNKQ